MTHKATPEQWDDAGGFAWDTRACLLELRDRIAALEAAANAQPQAPAPAGGLVERVAQAIATDSGQPLHSSAIAEWSDEARAAILAVAEWVDAQRPSGRSLFATWLREEVERHG
jgi:hypothetical protein